MNAAYLTPAITLFNEDGTLDLASQERLFNNLIDQGVDGILVEGSSSEFFAMPMNQRREMAKFAIEKIDLFGDAPAAATAGIAGGDDDDF